MTMSSNLTPFSPVLGVAAVVDDGSFLRAHGLASSKVHRTEERNKIVLLNLVYERKVTLSRLNIAATKIDENECLVLRDNFSFKLRRDSTTGGRVNHVRRIGHINQI